MNGVGDCPFCGRIERGEFDYDDQWCVAFQPLNPVTPGHFLVVPRKHVSHTLESPFHAARALQFAGYLANQMGLASANFITSAGRDATQTVFHLHLHVVPRREDDGLALPWTGQAVKLTAEAELAQFRAVAGFWLTVDEDGEIILSAPCADTLGCLWYSTASGERVTLGDLAAAAAAHTGEAAGKVHAALAATIGGEERGKP